MFLMEDIYMYLLEERTDYKVRKMHFDYPKGNTV